MASILLGIELPWACQCCLNSPCLNIICVITFVSVSCIVQQSFLCPFSCHFQLQIYVLCWHRLQVAKSPFVGQRVSSEGFGLCFSLIDLV